jgi:predicted DNA-binding transcriptional regulator YafY
MRAGRLVALLLHLQDRREATAQQLAHVLEVSVRTVYRDIATLQQAGVPLWTETGPGGGVRLVPGWRTRLDGLTGDEAAALFLSGGGAAAAADLGLGAVLAAAQTKVLSTLPAELRQRAWRVRERFHLDAPDWFARPDETTHLPTVAEAVWQARRVDVRYRRGDGVTVQRRLDPLGLVLKAGRWYLVARHRGDVRTYRVGRIATAALRVDSFDRPDGFDLAAWWAESAADFDRSVLRDTVRLRLDRAGARLLPHVTNPAPARVALESASPPDGDGWITVALDVESEAVALDQLTALGPHVEILEPRSLRAAFADIGRAMASTNSA